MRILYLLLFLLLFVLKLLPQDSNNLIYVDDKGRMRWTSTDEEAYFFGVNYSTPFAFSYRALKDKGISHKEIIDLDVQEFKRLGLNAYRIHVWDREVSDREGNLLDNEHIELLDYLISKLIENDIYIILTPIAWWGTRWPMPDVETPGFSTFYSKIESTTKPEVLNAHIKYLKQFVNHINKFTGKSYKDEKNIIGFEIFNEPNLPDSIEQINYYINTTVKAVRDEGVTKPIFFNISENPGKKQWEGVASSNIQGVSFQWYPTGLVKYSELKGNFLSNVLSYPLYSPGSPLYERGDIEGLLKNKAKIVYEFDAADIGKSYMYPVMAHSFKEAGMQFAAMFCYDPTPLAQFNSEYSTHYLNLLYTPQKALGFYIAANLFRYENIERKKLESTSVIMGKTKVDYDKDLSLLNTSERFYYTNNNDVIPKNVNKLKHIAGYGNSNLIKYGGRGTYFLDKINDDVWKLEVFPDAVWLKDPFGKNGLDNPVAKLIWKSHEMKINFPGLNSNFKVYTNGDKSVTADNFSISIEPGIYFITNEESFSSKDLNKDNIDFEKIIKYGKFIDDFQSTEIKNLTPASFNENDEKKIVVEIFSKVENPEALIYIRKAGWRNPGKYELTKVDDFRYEFTLPLEISSNGKSDYFITLKQNDELLTFPGKLNISPENWAFDPDDSYQLSILPASNKTTIYDPEKDVDNLIFSNIWRYARFKIDYTFDNEDEGELNVKINNVREQFPEFAMQFYVGEYIKNINRTKNDKFELEIKKTEDGPDSIFVRALFIDGSGFKRKINLSSDYEKITVPMSQPENFRYALLPRPYPTFLPYWFESTPQLNTGNNNLKLESIQIALPLPEPGKDVNDYGIKLKKINFVKNEIE